MLVNDSRILTSDKIALLLNNPRGHDLSAIVQAIGVVDSRPTALLTPWARPVLTRLGLLNHTGIPPAVEQVWREDGSGGINTCGCLGGLILAVVKELPFAPNADDAHNQLKSAFTIVNKVSTARFRESPFAADPRFKGTLLEFDAFTIENPPPGSAQSYSYNAQLILVGTNGSIWGFRFPSQTEVIHNLFGLDTSGLRDDTARQSFISTAIDRGLVTWNMEALEREIHGKRVVCTINKPGRNKKTFIDNSLNRPPLKSAEWFSHLRYPSSLPTATPT